MLQGFPVWKGFNFGQPQATRHADFVIGTTNAQPAVTTPSGIGRNIEKEQKKTRSALAAIPEPQCEPGWYICPFEGRKKKTWDNPAPEVAQNIKTGEAS